jgi:hypothetical protein
MAWMMALERLAAWIPENPAAPRRSVKHVRGVYGRRRLSIADEGALLVRHEIQVLPRAGLEHADVRGRGLLVRAPHREVGLALERPARDTRLLKFRTLSIECTL